MTCSFLTITLGHLSPVETREEKTYRNWMNSLGVSPRVNKMYRWAWCVVRWGLAVAICSRVNIFVLMHQHLLIPTFVDKEIERM